MPDALYDDDGLPLRRHRPCPRCDDTRALLSSFDEVWCTRCGWRGRLCEMHAPSPYPNMITCLKKESR